MADLSKCRPGNWLRYIRENQYCTFVSKDQYVRVEMYDGQRNLLEDDLTFIKLTPDFLPSCKFKPAGPNWVKEVAGKTISVSFSENRAYLSVGDDIPNLVGHLHTLQNTYHDLIGETLNPNIYGIHDPG